MGNGSYYEPVGSAICVYCISVPVIYLDIAPVLFAMRQNIPCQGYDREESEHRPSGSGT